LYLLAIIASVYRFKDGEEIRPGGKYRIVDDGNNVQLIIKGVAKDDAGVITCELSNSKGKETATAKLEVQSELFLDAGYYR